MKSKYDLVYTTGPWFESRWAHHVYKTGVHKKYVLVYKTGPQVPGPGGCTLRIRYDKVVNG
jgi:hypothetical protein